MGVTRFQLSVLKSTYYCYLINRYLFLSELFLNLADKQLLSVVGYAPNHEEKPHEDKLVEIFHNQRSQFINYWSGFLVQNFESITEALTNR